MANWRYNAYANTVNSNGSAILLASVGTLRALRSGAAYLER
jgi:hypothetical protein